ncbi:MAG: HGGxSTG domain-containing protein [Candidatus Ozemobacteraceae bacterium]
MKDDIRPHAIQQFRDIPRCGAKTRKGTPCPNPCVKGRPRCRMHGCAPGAGGQPGNMNALKHGLRSRKMIMLRKKINWVRREMRELGLTVMSVYRSGMLQTPSGKSG